MISSDSVSDDHIRRCCAVVVISEYSTNLRIYFLITDVAGGSLEVCCSSRTRNRNMSVHPRFILNFLQRNEDKGSRVLLHCVPAAENETRVFSRPSEPRHNNSR